MKHIITTTIMAAALLMPAAALADSRPKTVLDLRESITDSHIVYPESFETDTQKLLESWYMRNYTATDDRYKGSDTNTGDEVIKKRLAALPTVIDMPFNKIVRSYIDRYTRKSRPQVAAILGLGNYYMPIFEQALEEAGLPLELKYLPVIESGLDPNAVSRHGATGLWQFMLGTAKGLGLEVNSLVDERRDPYLSSEKAAGYLKDLHDAYGDWSLAIAAYNCGPGTVNKAIRRAGADPTQTDFWAIYNYLPAETRGYVPMFIAANYVMNYYPEHNISPVLPTKPLVTDTVTVNDRVHFNQISHVLDIPVEELRLLNPQYRADLIPGDAGRPCRLILPSQQVHAYIMSEPQIIEYEADRYARRLTAEPGGIPSDASLAQADMTDTGEEDVAAIRAAAAANNVPAATGTGTVRSLTHKVAAGETLASIAERYDVEPQDIKRWNNLRRNAVRVGQQLRISAPATAAATQPAYTPARDNTATASQQRSKASKKAESRKSKRDRQKASRPAVTDHRISSGENLISISKRYGVSVDELRRANNIKGDAIRAGDKLKIPAAKSSKSKSRKSKKSKRRRR